MICPPSFFCRVCKRSPAAARQALRPASQGRSIPLRFISLAGVRPPYPASRCSLLRRAARFRFAPSRSRAFARLIQPAVAACSAGPLDSASLHLARGRSPALSSRPLRPAPQGRSIPLRSISLAGVRPPDASRKETAFMQACRNLSFACLSICPAHCLRAHYTTNFLLVQCFPGAGRFLGIGADCFLGPHLPGSRRGFLSASHNILFLSRRIVRRSS